MKEIGFVLFLGLVVALVAIGWGYWSARNMTLVRLAPWLSPLAVVMVLLVVGVADGLLRGSVTRGVQGSLAVLPGLGCMLSLPAVLACLFGQLLGGHRWNRQ